VLRGPCRDYIRERENGKFTSLKNIRGLNLAVVKLTTIQMTNLPL
jgi:hypothetical protein